MNWVFLSRFVWSYCQITAFFLEKYHKIITHVVNEALFVTFFCLDLQTPAYNRRCLTVSIHHFISSSKLEQKSSSLYLLQNTTVSHILFNPEKSIKMTTVVSST